MARSSELSAESRNLDFYVDVVIFKTIVKDLASVAQLVGASPGVSNLLMSLGHTGRRELSWATH